MKSLIFFDTETTSKDNARLVQIAWAVDDKEIECLICKPADDIAIEATEIHGITNEDVKDLEPFAGEVGKFQSIFDGNIAVAHNAKFDVGVMEREGVMISQYIDTLQVARHLLPDMPAHRLQYLRYALKLQMSEENLTAHDARGDVAVLRSLFNYLFEETDVMLEKEGLYTGDNNGEQVIYDRMIELTNTPCFLKVMTQNKHRGKTFEEVARTDRGYLVWLASQTELSSDLEATLKYWLNK